MSSFVVHTPLSRMRPIGSEGERSHERTGALLARHLSQEHAALLADPVPLRDGSGIDWYVDTEGVVLPLEALGEADRAAVRDRLAALLAEIREAADRLGTEGRQRGPAAALRNAAVFPHEACLYAVREKDALRPLVVGWGYESQEPALVQAFNVSVFAQGAPRARARDKTPRPSGLGGHGGGLPPVHPGTLLRSMPSSAVPSRGVLRWLAGFLAALVALLLFLLVGAYLLPACGLRTPFGTVLFGFPDGAFCVRPPEMPGLSRSRDHERELAVLQEEYRRRRIDCLTAAPAVPPPEPAVPEPPATPPPPDREAYDRVDRRGEVQVTLTWNSTDDLDLILACPNGQNITYRSKMACGGELDIDQNAREISQAPVENITFYEGLQSDGAHDILVNLYGSRGGKLPVPFKLTIRNEDGTREIDGALTQPNQTINVAPLIRGAGHGGQQPGTPR